MLYRMSCGHDTALDDLKPEGRVIILPIATFRNIGITSIGAGVNMLRDVWGLCIQTRTLVCMCVHIHIMHEEWACAKIEIGNDSSLGMVNSRILNRSFFRQAFHMHVNYCCF